MKKTDILIQHKCPQCGAPAVLEETDRLFECEYCKVRSYLLQKNFFRYILPHKASEDKEIVYFPYWRFRGTLFSCFAKKDIEEKFTDISYPAANTDELPMSLGFRTQALKLRFLSSEIKGNFVKPTLAIKDVMNIFRQIVNESTAEPPLYQKFIGDNLSLIYAPYYLQDDVWHDAILNAPLPSLSASHAEYYKPDAQIHFIPALCPNCGGDLEGNRNALSLTCRRCYTIWKTEKNQLTPMSYAVIGSDVEDTVWMPFWKIKAEVSGVKLDSYADLIRLANLPKAVLKTDESEEFYFWIPAFRVFPLVFLRLARGMITVQPKDELTNQLPDGTVYSVTFPYSEAVRSLKIHVIGMIKPRKQLKNIIDKIEIRNPQALLVYVPFQDEAHELIHYEYHLSVHKNLFEILKD